jgi:hypothetical protein
MYTVILILLYTYCSTGTVSFSVDKRSTMSLFRCGFLRLDYRYRYQIASLRGILIKSVSILEPHPDSKPRFKDPDWYLTKSFGSMQIRVHNTGFYRLRYLNLLSRFW